MATTYLSDKYLTRPIDYNRLPVSPSALVVIRHNSGFTLAYDDGRPDLCGIRENAPDSARQAFVDEAKAKRLAVLTMNAPAFRYEAGADNKPQAVIPGAERLASSSIAQMRANQPLRAKRAQRACDVGLFSDDADQLDLVSWFTEQTEE